MSDNKITEQLKKVASDVLTEETLSTIEEAFNQSVQEKSEELANLRIEKALIEQDEEHAIKLEKLLEAIDTDHTTKLQRVVKAIDTNHSQKLIALAERFKNELESDASTFKESVVDNISNYLDLYVEKVIPTEDIQEAVKNKHAATILENLRKTLSIDSALSNSDIREAVLDGKKQIDEASDTVKKLEQQNKVLQENLSKERAKVTLEQLTSGLPSSKKRHIEKVLAGKSAEFITENFQYTLDMFDKTEAQKLTQLKEEAESTKKHADRPVSGKKEVVQESVADKIEQQDPNNYQDKNLFNNYMGELGRW